MENKEVWGGMKAMPIEQAKMLHEQNALAGLFKLYPDGTDAEIDSAYKWAEIEKLYQNGGTVGEEKPRRVYNFNGLDGKIPFSAPETVEIPSDTEELLYDLRNVVGDYLFYFGIEVKDGVEDDLIQNLALAMQNALITTLEAAGVNFGKAKETKEPYKPIDVAAYGDKIGEVIIEEFEDINNNATDIGHDVCRSFNECLTKEQFDSVNHMLIAITGSSIDTILDTVKQRDDQKWTWLSE